MKKCFKVNLELLANNLKPLVQSCFSFANATKDYSIEKILQVVGFVEHSPQMQTYLNNVLSGLTVSAICFVSYMLYKRWEGGRKIDSCNKIADDCVEIEIDDEKIYITYNLYKLLEYIWQKDKSGSFFGHIKQHFKPNGNKKYQINQDAPTEVKRDLQDELIKQEDDYNIDGIMQAQEQDAIDLIIRTPDLTGNKRWSFILMDETITPSYNQDIADFLKTIKTNLGVNPFINVKLKIEWRIDNEGKTIEKSKKYTILQINGCLQNKL